MLIIWALLFLFPPFHSSDPFFPYAPTCLSARVLTCVKVEDARGLPLHRHGYVVSLDVGGADAAVGQHDLKQLPAALHAVQGQFAQTWLDVRLVGVEGLVKDILHDLQKGEHVLFLSEIKCASERVWGRIDIFVLAL